MKITVSLFTLVFVLSGGLSFAAVDSDLGHRSDEALRRSGMDEASRAREEARRQRQSTCQSTDGRMFYQASTRQGALSLCRFESEVPHKCRVYKCR